MGSEPTNCVSSPMDSPEGFPISAHVATMKSSAKLNDKSTIVSGYDFNEGIDHKKLLLSMLTMGFRASHLGRAIVLVNNMLDWRLSGETIEEGCNEEERDPALRQSVKCKIFMGFTSNHISSGLRDSIRFLAEHCMLNNDIAVLFPFTWSVASLDTPALVTKLRFKLAEKCVQVDVLVTTTGGVEEDLIKCLAPTYTGDFSLPKAQLHSNGLNQIGNLLVLNDNYCKFEDWIIPIFYQLLKEQKEQAFM